MTVKEMAENWLKVVRKDIAQAERELERLKRHEQECMAVLAEEK